jgi:ribosomal protein S18 acetylase RimI-like enzyme
VFAYFQELSTYPLCMFPAMRYYLGTFHGKVVAIGTLFVGTQTVGVYDIVTHNDYRRRGIGSAMFQRLLKDACAENRRFCVLQASKDGLGIYLKAGFSVTGDVLTFDAKI